jgi:hypothetical protein
VRLRQDATAVEACLAAVERSDQARALVDAGKVRDCWQTVQQFDGVSSLRESGFILLRGLMAGLFLPSVNPAKLS